MAAPNTKRLTQAERTAISDRRIMDAAIKLIARQGYSKTTLAQIGKEAGYTAGHVSHRFGSKDGLLFRVAEMIVSSTGTRLIAPAAEGLRGIAALCAVAHAYVSGLSLRADRTRALFILMFESLGPVPALRPFFVEYTEKMRTDLEQAIAEGIDAGEIRPDVDPADEAVVIVGVLRGVAMQWLMDPACVDTEAVSTRISASIRRALEPDPRAGIRVRSEKQ
jgi:AcrR family transcriptional regulator